MHGHAVAHSRHAHIVAPSLDLTNTMVAALAALGLPTEVNQGILNRDAWIAGLRASCERLGAMEKCAAAPGGVPA
jgi:hypothetical protein